MMDLIQHVPWLREQLGRCASAAMRERDPQLYAALFLEELPEGLKPERVLQLLSQSDWYQTLSQFDARIAHQGPWWTVMRDQLIAYIQESLTPDPAQQRRASGEIERPAALPSLTGE